MTDAERSLPGQFLVEWRVGAVTLTSIIGRPADAPEMSKFRLWRVTVRPYVPAGATAWRVSGESAWRPLATLPPAWGLRPLGRQDIPTFAEDEEDEWTGSSPVR